MVKPSYYLPIMPYLILKDAVGFLEFAKEVFAAKEKMIVPGQDGDGRSIMHGELMIGEAVVMFANATAQWGEKSSGMFLYVDDVDSVHRRALTSKAKELNAPALQEYGYSSGFEDPFGNHWWITNGSSE